ncbi:histidinol-phosphatase HisJ [Halobacillus rhizosphaerae]|uniref:histidinol-phosphatase HisJ n=1 Tax=Halobacillus rhizosphaerae TaxID=3064889 RepID=UPI00398A6ED7
MFDGHIHSPYCPHGSTDNLKAYIEQAIQLNYHMMTFTEHAPLPEGFQDPVPSKDSGMDRSLVEPYLQELQKLKKEYEQDITINAGFEIDFIKGFEEQTLQFLNTYGPEMDDGILSVHFLEGKKQWYCIDYSPEMFEETVKDFGSLEKVYQTYFQALSQSAESSLGRYKPNRIGHMTLVKKFQSLFPAPETWEEMAASFLESAQQNMATLDYNGAGVNKTYCKESYPPKHIANLASSMGIPLIYGSDAHTSHGLKQGAAQIDQALLTRSL